MKEALDVVGQAASNGIHWQIGDDGLEELSEHVHGIHETVEKIVNRNINEAIVSMADEVAAHGFSAFLKLKDGKIYLELLGLPEFERNGMVYCLGVDVALRAPVDFRELVSDPDSALGLFINEDAPEMPEWPASELRSAAKDLRELADRLDEAAQHGEELPPPTT